MRRVHVSESLLEIAHLRNLLESAGIACFVRNERLGGAVGEIPFLECWPELWVCKSGQALRARGLIDEALSPRVACDPWVCPRCGERIEGQFSECWRCAAPGASEGPVE
jgi:hypothetical protein